MADSFDDILKAATQRQVESGYHPQPPCPAEKVARLRERVRSSFDTEVPEGYIEFLQKMNGLDFNGTLFFAAEPEHDVDTGRVIEGFVEANELIREAANQFLTFGVSGMEMYSLNVPGQHFAIVDRVSLDEIERWRSFEDLASHALRMRL